MSQPYEEFVVDSSRKPIGRKEEVKRLQFWITCGHESQCLNPVIADIILAPKYPIFVGWHMLA